MTGNFRFSDEHFPSNGKPPPVYFDWDKERQKAWWLESDQRKEQDGGTNTSSLADEIEAAKRQHRQRARGGNGAGNDDAGPQGKPGQADETVVSFDRYERRNKSSNGNGRGDSDERPVIQLSTDLHADLIACERELISSSLVEVYQRAGNIVRRGTAKGKAHTGETVVFDRITHHNPNSLRTVLAKTIVFEGWNEKKKKFVLRHPPKDYAGCLLDHPDKNYPILHGLISAPTLRADGSILDVSGYDERSGLYFDPKGADFGTIPINPTRGDALAALKELDEPIAKFPFVDEASKSVQLARMLTGIVRTALMTSPMFAYTAPTPRTGKSLLVDIACILSHGHVAPVIVASSTFEERDKQLQAALAGGDTIVALDNQNSDEALTSDALSQMLTQPIVKVRPFGQNKEMLEYPSMSVISVTGNNLAVAKDLTERTVLCQVDAKMEVPGSRKFTFNPIVMARQNRVRLVRACLIILRAYVVAGRPPQDFNPMGGFEDWSEWVRSAIVWLGRADPCATMSVVRSKDQGRGVHVTIMELWEQAIGFDVEISATEVAKCAKQREESGRPDFNSALWMTVGKNGKNLPMALGRWLASKCGVVIGGRRFVAGGRSGHPTYRLETIGEEIVEMSEGGI